MPASLYVRANGINIHFLREGRGPPLVLLHGWPEFCRVWEPVMSSLRGRFELFAPDLRGFGDTTKPYAGPTEDMTSHVLADDLGAFLDALDLNGSVGLVAHDVGAIVAQVFARRSPERLSGLFFFNCPHSGIGSRWIAPDHVPEVWYQTFHCLPWSASMVGASGSILTLSPWAALKSHTVSKLSPLLNTNTSASVPAIASSAGANSPSNSNADKFIIRHVRPRPQFWKEHQRRSSLSYGGQVLHLVIEQLDRSVLRHAPELARELQLGDLLLQRCRTRYRLRYGWWRTCFPRRSNAFLD
jgi:pimeloyl-ACP methyl ester carboxylesterase